METRKKPVSIVYDDNMNPLGVKIETLDENFTIALTPIDNGHLYTWHEAMDRLKELGLQGISKKQMALITAYNIEVDAALMQAGGSRLRAEWSVGEYYSSSAWLYYPAYGAMDVDYKCYAYQVRPLLASKETD